MNVFPLLDAFMAKGFDGFEPHYNVPSMNKPFDVSGNLTLLGPVSTIVSEYLDIPEPSTVITDKVVEQLEFA